MPLSVKYRICQVVMWCAVWVSLTACSPTQDHSAWHTGDAALPSKVSAMGPSAPIGP